MKKRWKIIDQSVHRGVESCARTTQKEVVKIITIYSVVGGLWIYFSDALLRKFVSDRDTLSHLSVYKGLAFIVLTASLLYVLISRYLSKFLRKLRLGSGWRQALIFRINGCVFLSLPHGWGFGSATLELVKSGGHRSVEKYWERTFLYLSRSFHEWSMKMTGSSLRKISPMP